jgi:hypothetical protein
MVRQPRSRVALSARILRTTTQYCGRKMRVLTLDHVVRTTAALGPTLRLLTCNRRKGGKRRPKPRWLRRLPFEQTPPPPTLRTHLEQRQGWAQFIEGW